MKLRIVEVFDSTICPWFKLEQWLVTWNRWAFVNGAVAVDQLEAQAAAMLKCPRPRVIKVFTDEPPDLIDIPAPEAHPLA